MPMQQRNMNVYATAHLSGDVANAVTLLKRMTRPSTRKHKAGLLIPSTDLAACPVRAPLDLAKSNNGLKMCAALQVWDAYVGLWKMDVDRRRRVSVRERLFGL